MLLSRDNVFERITVDYLIRGVSRVNWELRPRFVDIRPYIFQLEVSRNGGVDWLDVGLPVEDVYYALDDQQRLYGQDRRLTYRVKFTTGDNDYISPEAETIGRLSQQQWLLAREIVRRIAIKSRGMRSFQGFIFRRRLAGTKCPDCLDTLTGGIRNSSCNTCNGTGFVDGYFLSAPVTMYDMSPDFRETHNRDQTGTVSPSVVAARFIGLPQINTRDVWVSTNDDQRYVVHAVKHMSELNGVPLAVEAELKPVEYTDLAYKLEVPA